MRHCLSVDDELVLLDHRIVIPTSQHTNVLLSLHSAHQGEVGMKARAARAILQYRNTPIQNIGLSPSQLLLHCRLLDFIPSQPTLYKPHADWIAAAKNREIILSHRNTCLIEQYNKTTHTLCPLQKGQIVTVQRPTTHR